ncbi:MAG: AraC family transcriptional regulator [Anaerolineae bacterium]|nr:AraC family transcriptional regulator [Anaerolineae bacterium]
MSDLALMLKAIEFIEAHLTDEISVADMAEAVSFSLYHFSRTFSRVTHFTPYDYLMRRRLCEAARCLLTSDEKIIDIACQYQFNAPETFSRAFKRVFQLSPRQAKLHAGFDQRRLMSRLTPEYLEFLNGSAPLKPQLKKLPALRLAGLVTQLSPLDPNRDLLTVWNLLAQAVQSEEIVPSQRDYCGVRMCFPAYPANRYMYLAGTVLGEDETVPAFFVQKNLAALDWVCIELSNHPQAACFTRNYVYQTWWSKTTAMPLALVELECFSAEMVGQASLSGVPLPQTLCFPLPIE